MRRFSAFVVWCVFLGFGLAADRAAAQCAVWSSPELLTNTPYDSINTRYNVDSSLAVDSAGKVHLIYQSFLSPTGKNYYITDQGGSWSQPVNLGSMSDKGSAPKIVITPDDQLHAFFGRNNLYWRTRPVNGGSWSAPVEVAVNPTGGNFIQSVTVDSTGGIYLTWGHLFDNTAPARNGIYGRYKPLGGSWAATELVYGNSDDGNWPLGTDVAANGTTLWTAIEMNNGVYYKKKSVAGAWPAGLGTQLASGAGALRFAFSPVGNEIGALYQKNIGCGDVDCEDAPWFEIYARYSSNDGASWSAEDNVSALRNDIDRGPSPVYDANGNLHVVWESFCCDHKLRMRYRSRIGGVWGSQLNLSSLQGGHIPRSLVARGLDLYCTFSNTGTGASLYDVMFARYITGLTNLTLNKTSLSYNVMARGSLANDSFTVVNGCAGTLSYTITKNAAWLEVSPASGTSTTETDTITVSYPGVPSLPAGVYTDTLTVSGNAWNTPKTIAVQVKVRTVKPDLDGDGDVDQGDFGILQRCLTGQGVGVSNPACVPAALDAIDNDVDADDLNILLGCYSGPEIVANPACAPLYPL